jgi:imidazole glycerol-phosphate synthase subunit HisF
MLKIRIIPTLLLKDLWLVKGIWFDSWRRIGTVLPAIKVYNTRQVDELILLDISATRENRDLDYEEIKEFSAECFVPFTIGGWIKNIDQVRNLLKSWADKIALNTAIFENPKLITEIAKTYGSQCVVASIDVKKVGGKYVCFSHSWTIDTGRDPREVAKEVEKLWAGEILLTSIERDGTMEWLDIDLIKSISGNVSIPVIAGGGVGNYEDMEKAITQWWASAIAAASIFQFTEQTPIEAKKFLGEKWIPVRKSFYL